MKMSSVFALVGWLMYYYYTCFTWPLTFGPHFLCFHASLLPISLSQPLAKLHFYIGERPQVMWCRLTPY